jgi:hypothetical protein
VKTTNKFSRGGGGGGEDDGREEAIHIQANIFNPVLTGGRELY